jgi:hypothetical protein
VEGALFDAEARSDRDCECNGRRASYRNKALHAIAACHAAHPGMLQRGYFRYLLNHIRIRWMLIALIRASNKLSP